MKTKKIYFVLVLTFLALTGCVAHYQTKNIILETENLEVSGTQSKTEEIIDLPDSKQESGTEIYYGETQISRYIPPFNVEELTLDIWQDTYADLLKKSIGNNFYLCDIDSDGTPELLIGGPSSDTYKYDEYDIYTYKNNQAECLGTIGTLRWSSFWLDGNCGILGYSYGAGGGGTFRYYIDDGVLYDDGGVNGYYYDSNGNCIEWFRGPDKSEIIVTEENKFEYERIWESMIGLERYIATDDTIATVIYGES